jgi:zinc resistance-associated protein
MRTKIIVAGVLASMVTAAVAVAQTAPAPGGPGGGAGPERQGRFGRMFQMSPDDRAAFLDARIAGLKTVLRLTAEQERHWPAFEAALREGAAFRAQRMTERVQRWREMRENRDAPRPDPIQRLRAASERMAAGAAVMKKLADAGAPLYASLDENQKRRAERIMMRRGMMGGGMMGGHPGMMHRWGRGGEDGPRRGPGSGEGGRL